MDIQLPPRFVAVPAKVIYSDLVSSSDKEFFLRLLGLAWEYDYKRTADLPLKDLLRFLGISHATFYRKIGKLASEAWLLSMPTRPGCVRFAFPLSQNGQGNAQEPASLKFETRVSNLRLPPEDEDEEEDLLINLKDPPPPHPPQSLKNETVSKMRLLQSAGVKPDIAQKVDQDPETSLDDILANIAYAHDPRISARQPAIILGINLLNGYRPDATYYGDPARIPAAILERAGLASLLEPDSSDGAEPTDEPTAYPQVDPGEPSTGVEHVVAPSPDLDQLISGTFTARKAWQAARDQLQMELPKAVFDAWLSQAELLAYRDGAFTIGCPNAYAAMWLESRLTSTLTRLLTGICNRSAGVQFVALSLAE